MIGPRRKGRTIALQILYEVDLVEHGWETILARHREESGLSEEILDFASELVKGVLESKEPIDSVIRRFATLWPVEQISVIDRNILRVAIFEILFDNRTPFKASINEAVELAKNFGSENSARFINGVLGSMVREHDIRFRKEASNSGNGL
jgi:N utilization substance protein B